MNISVIGLGKLGLCTAACFASKGHNVVGMDKNPDFISALQNRNCPIDETGLEELLERAWDNLTVTGDIAEAVENSDFTLIIVPTPSKPDGSFTNEYVEAVLNDIGPTLAQKQSFHVVDVVSTVMPGSSDRTFKPMLERLTAKTCGEDFGLVYNPEFIALGSVVRDFLNPDMVLIGASDERSADMASELYRTTCDSSPKIAAMSLVNAEITKLTLNCFCTMKISFANELASICEHVPGADVDVITEAIGADSRIGSKYIKGGLGFAGPCFPRDNLAFQRFAFDLGREARLGPQVVGINKSVVDRIIEKIESQVRHTDTIAILGLSYKPNTHIIEESQSILLAQRLAEAGYEVNVYDPRALDSARMALKDKAAYYTNAEDCILGASAAVFMTNWPEFGNIDINKAAAAMSAPQLIIDSWRIFRDKDKQNMNYNALGLGNINEKIRALTI